MHAYKQLSPSHALTVLQTLLIDGHSVRCFIVLFAHNENLYSPYTT